MILIYHLATSVGTSYGTARSSATEPPSWEPGAIQRLVLSTLTFAMLSLWDALRVPSTMVPVDVVTAVSYILPPIVCYFIVAVLAVTPQTRNARVALWPLVVLLVLRAAFAVDMSLGHPEQTPLRACFVVSGTKWISKTRFTQRRLTYFSPAPPVEHCCPYSRLDTDNGTPCTASSSSK